MWGLLKFTTRLGIKQRQVYHASGADLQFGSMWGSTYWQTTHSALWLSIITPTVMKKHLPSDVILIYSAGSRPVEIRWEFWWKEYSSGNIHVYVKQIWVTTIRCVYELLHWFWLARFKMLTSLVSRLHPALHHLHFLFTCTWGKAGSEAAC